MKKLIKTLYISTAMLFLLVFAFGCKKDPVSQPPILKTLPVINITTSSAGSGGDISAEGTASVVAKGVCWSVNQNPTIKYKDSITSDGTGIGIFNSTITGLKQGRTYYIRAYASNSAGTGYGNQVQAIVAAALPTVTTTAILATSETAVSSGGVVVNNGGSVVTARGVCWSSAKDPTVANYSTTDGSGDGSFVSTISGLAPDAVYYLRAYATNSTGIAYGKELSFSTGKLLVKDTDGNFYHFVTIGSQVWMTENLRTTRYRDSTLIPLVLDNSVWSSQVMPGYSWYNDDVNNKNSYGALYNWYAVNSGKLCPTGWHVPTDAEWTTLTTRLGGESLAGGKLKESGTTFWKSPNANATNETGFTALPGGFRTNTGEYGNAGSYGNWWSTTTSLANVANYRYLYYGNGTVTKSFVNQKYGLSVRCLKN